MTAGTGVVTSQTAIFAAAFATLLFPLYLSLLAGSNKIFEPQSFDFALVAVAWARRRCASSITSSCTSVAMCMSSTITARSTWL